MNGLSSLSISLFYQLRVLVRKPTFICQRKTLGYLSFANCALFKVVALHVMTTILLSCGDFKALVVGSVGVKVNLVDRWTLGSSAERFSHLYWRYSVLEHTPDIAVVWLDGQDSVVGAI